MPTFTDPRTDAAEASEALRGLAHATIRIDQPAQMYPVLGDLLAGVRSLRQVLDQLAAAHVTGQPRAFDDQGDAAIGAKDALAAADELHQAATLIDAAHDRLDAAMNAAGRIAWRPDPETARRWVSVVFFDGEEADRVLDLIQRDGTTAGIEHLSQWDYGEETTDAALTNGYVYDTPPVGNLDRTTTEGNYTLTYNPFLSHVSLLRAYDAPADFALAEPAPAPAVAAVGLGEGAGRAAPSTDTVASATTRKTPAVAGKDWFAATPRPAQHAGRGLGR
ncbi:hypothetical protein ACX1DX_03535 [Tessaracoccus sp. Y36]|uniref:Uncharacterized protein n=1 Tax=Microbacterium ginsengisoli TaxID=400772 RepID=A0A0F0LUN4_9MICO|nr:MULTISPECIES: hypothetical protein [Actinomycetes]KJL36419.1 hypothetical protein RR49_01755 [Microbacterium ginsengisoli]MDI9960453.1 hypothetical protein [Rhodococcus sp. IEGM 1237]MDI9966295.1 hypothetical protein [Rhodococcus sp. IEGM 1251]MDV8128631.1 hypothetical protein [Rhodococcus sp. IEGM 1304]MEE1622454.1 hypothetical protein [Zafaria sp. J156]